MLKGRPSGVGGVGGGFGAMRCFCHRLGHSREQGGGKKPSEKQGQLGRRLQYTLRRQGGGEGGEWFSYGVKVTWPKGGGWGLVIREGGSIAEQHLSVAAKTWQRKSQAVGGCSSPIVV